MTKFVGTGVALITPFNKDLSVDFDALTKLVEYNIANGIEYLVISGTTGESATITREEKEAITSHIVKVNNGRLPLVLGIGGNNTQAIIDEINTTDLSSIDAILSVSPYYSKPTQQGIHMHFQSISKASPVPIILYNVPGRTSKNMLPETIIRLANDFENIIAVKEAGNNFAQYLELIRNKPKDFHIISGDDDLALAIALAGGSGVISVIGQALPREISDMIRYGIAKDADASYKIYFELIGIINLIFSENNPAGIKAVLQTINISKSYVKLPLVEASEDLKKTIANELKRLGKR